MPAVGSDYGGQCPKCGKDEFNMTQNEDDANKTLTCLNCGNEREITPNGVVDKK